jgi:hypothetical protein
MNYSVGTVYVRLQVIRNEVYKSELTCVASSKLSHEPFSGCYVVMRPKRVENENAVPGLQ